MTTTADAPTTATHGNGRPATDPIDLEVLRSRLEAIGEQAALAVEHTAISPTVTESKDYSVTILDPQGDLIVGAGMVLFHFGAAVARGEGDHRPLRRHHGPGRRVLRQRPAQRRGAAPPGRHGPAADLPEGELVGWVGLSAHMMDMGGMVVGSFAPQATECYQEGLRCPPVRLFRKGEEMTDVWDILINNIRMSDLVEMDLRGLVAGCHFAQEQVVGLVDSIGRDRFADSLRAIRDLTEAEMRRRILALEDGVYRSTSWTEFDDEFFEIPCTLTVDGDHMIFDFEGASPQTDHYFNSKPYIIAAEFLVMLAHRMARDLPFNEGIFAPVELRCPEGTVVNANPPAPIAAAHMHVGLNAADVAMQAFNLALGRLAGITGPALPGRGRLRVGPRQQPVVLAAARRLDRRLPGLRRQLGGRLGRPRPRRDGPRAQPGRHRRRRAPSPTSRSSSRGTRSCSSSAGPGPGAGGAGVHRAGGGNQLSLRPHGVDQINGTMFGMRRWLPLQGMAGGSPGACNEFLVHRTDGTVEELDPNSAGTPLFEGDSFQMRLSSGGGFGDALDRDPESVAVDVAAGRFSAEDAASIYGTVLTADGDGRRGGHRSAAPRAHGGSAWPRPKPAPRPQGDRQAPASDEPSFPLYPGVAQRGNLAYAEESGQVLAESPHHWTDGCPVLEERRWPDGVPTWSSAPTSTRSRAGPCTSRWRWPTVLDPLRSIRAAGPAQPDAGPRLHPERGLTCTTCSSRVGRSSTAQDDRATPLTSRSPRADRVDRRDDGCRPPHDRRHGFDRVPRVHRCPHALRRAGPVGPDALPLAAPRCHHRGRRQLRDFAGAR